MVNFIQQYCNIYVVDEFHTLTDEIRDRFKNSLKYHLQIFTDIEKEFQELTSRKVPGNRTRISVIVMNRFISKKELDQKIKDFVSRMEHTDPKMNILFVVEKKARETMPKVLEGTRYTVIPKNENVVLRITNYIMGIISKENLETKFRKAKRMAWIFGLFVLAISLITMLLYFLCPAYF